MKCIVDKLRDMQSERKKNYELRGSESSVLNVHAYTLDNRYDSLPLLHCLYSEELDPCLEG